MPLPILFLSGVVVLHKMSGSSADIYDRNSPPLSQYAKKLAELKKKSKNMKVEKKVLLDTSWLLVSKIQLLWAKEYGMMSVFDKNLPVLSKLNGEVLSILWKIYVVGVTSQTFPDLLQLCAEKRWKTSF